MSIRELIAQQAAARPDAVYALSTEGGTSLTFAELDAGSRRLGALLRRHGLGPGDTVSLVMPNGLQTMRILLGTMSQGLIVNPVNLLSQTEQMRYVLGHSDCKLVFAAPEWEAPVRALLAGLDREVALVVAEPDGLRLPSENDEAFGAAPVPANAVALLMYTSGTTGVPKGVMLSQANLVANARSISVEHALTSTDRVLGVLPLYHINAFAVTMLAPLAHGGSVAVAPRFSAARFWAQAFDNHCTWVNVVPTIISFLIEGETPAAEALARIRFCRSASAALPPEHLLAFERKFGIGIIETMGLTECVAPCFSNPLEPARRKVGAVGRASGCEARIIDSAGMTLPDGQRGEIAIRGPNVMRGYYKNDSATTAAFTPDGWLRTGDLGHRDSDGFFYVTGRLKELIIKGGENIAPREIDEVLLAHPAVLDAAAVGMPDRHYGQEILAAVVLREGMGCSEEELREFCLQRLGRYKTPKTIRFVTELPRGPSGKVQRLKLLDS
jgi:acyl-CoA synthetase (AMP-forming)/AMP-acid ligase II